MLDDGVSKDLGNSCTDSKDQCLNCNKQFMTLRPLVRNVAVTKRFFKDFRDPEQAKTSITEILACSNVDFLEMHKF